MDEETIDREQFRIHQGIIFCIQLSPTICKIDPKTGKSILKLIFESMKELISDCAISLANTGVGCYLFNTTLKSTDDTNTKEDIYRVFRLSDINADMLKQVHDLIEDNYSFINDPSESPVKDANPEISTGAQLTNLLNLVQEDFIYLPRFTKTYTSKKIFLFTDCDKPFNNSITRRITLRKILGDFNESKIGISPFLLSTSEKQFDISEYRDLLFLKDKEVDNEEDEEGKEGKGQRGIETDDEDDSFIVDNINPDRIKQKVSLVKEVKRDAFNCPLEISGNLKINVKGYALFNETKIKSAYNFYSLEDKYYNIEVETHRLNANNGSEIPAESVTKMFSFGNELIPVSTDHLKRLYSFNMEFGKPVLKILGFRDLGYFHPGYSISTATLMVPDDTKDLTHCRRTFSALYQSLSQKRKMAILWGKTTKISYPALYCLIPTDKSLNFKTTKFQQNYYPQGLALIQIPWKDMIRCFPENKLPESVPLKQDNKFDKIIPSLINAIDYEKVKNPMINWHFKILEDDILQKEVNREDEEVKSTEDEFSKASNSLQLKNQVEMNNFDETKQLVMRTRTLMQNNKELNHWIRDLNNDLNKLSNQEVISKPETVPKKQRQSEKDFTDADMLLALKTNTLKSYTRDQLKPFILARKGLIDNATKKGDMIDNISEYLRKRYPSGEI